jgi:hypothetical protein
MSYLTNPYRYVVAGCSSFPDSLNTSANGSVTGAEINTSDPKLGAGCISFDGVNDFVNLDGIAGTNAFSTNVGSITIWINTSATQDDTLFSFGDTEATNYLVIRAQPQLGVGVYRGGAWQWEAQQTGLNDGEWHWVALVQDGVEVKFYMDNVEQTDFDNDADKSAWVTSVEDNCRIGCKNVAGTGNGDFFTGLIDDIGIFDSAIDSTIRDHLWNSGDGNTISSLTSCSNIKAYYNADELTNSTFTNNAVPI